MLLLLPDGVVPPPLGDGIDAVDPDGVLPPLLGDGVSAADPDGVAPPLGKHSELIFVYNWGTHVEHSPLESQSVQPVLLPLEPQQLPPRHTPLEQSLLEEHVPPSGFCEKHSLPVLVYPLEHVEHSPLESQSVQPVLLPLAPQQLPP